MAAINFPSSPADGETFTYSGKTFQWSSANGIWVRKPNGPIPIINVLDEVVLAGASTAPELTTVPITISNYDALNTYIITVSGGSYVRSGDTISWTLPIASGEDVLHSILVYASKALVGVSSIVQHDILVTDVVLNLQADTSIIIGNFGTDSTFTDWEI